MTHPVKFPRDSQGLNTPTEIRVRILKIRLGIVDIYMVCIVSLLVSGLCPSLVFAQSSRSKNNIRLKLEQPKLKTTAEKKAYEFQFRMRQTEYLGEAPDPAQPNRIYSFAGRYRVTSSLNQIFPFSADIKLISAERESEKPYMSVPNLYAGYSQRDVPVEVYFGRKTEEWSALDEQWKLGIWQPMARWDYIHPESLGLTGAFLKVGKDKVRVRVFATPFFLPDQGPNFELKDGQFQSNNRWFWTPQSEIGVLAQPSKLFFDLNRPSEAEVINHAGFGASLDLGNGRRGAWARFSYAQKPRNQLHLGIDGRMQIFKEGRTQVTIHPEVVYHDVATAEAGWKSRDLSLWGSVTHDSPRDPDLPDSWVQSELREIYVFGGLLEHSLGFIGLNKSRLRYSYMQIDEGRDLGKTSMLGGTVDSSLDRFMFQKVFSTEWVQRFDFTRRLAVRSGIKYMYSIPDDAGLFSLKTELLLGSDFILDFSADVLGASEKADEAGTGLMTRYRSNDRMAIGLTYVF